MRLDLFDVPASLWRGWRLLWAAWLLACVALGGARVRRERARRARRDWVASLRP